MKKTIKEDQTLEKAAFAAGCFWHVEETFRIQKGVISTTVGYMGGTTKNPTYEQVCTNTTGHAETVEITYNPKQITYQQLLDIFWSNHDPTTINRQGPDIGTQYRSIIFYYTQEQKNIAQQSKTLMQKKYSKPIVTEIIKATTFYRAEEYSKCVE